MGLVVFGVLAVYVVVLVGATWLAYRWAAMRGLPGGKRWLAAAGVFLVVYLPVFWDHIPTLIAHKYYCEKEAGFWVYKTLDQWKAENPGAAEALTWSEASPTSQSADGVSKLELNERISLETRRRHLPFLPTTVSEDIVVDRKNPKDVLARQVTVGSSYGNIGASGEWRALKFWLSLRACPPALEMRRFGILVTEFKRMGVKK